MDVSFVKQGKAMSSFTRRAAGTYSEKWFFIVNMFSIESNDSPFRGLEWMTYTFSLKGEVLTSHSFRDRFWALPFWVGMDVSFLKREKAFFLFKRRMACTYSEELFFIGNIFLIQEEWFLISRTRTDDIPPSWKERFLLLILGEGGTSNDLILLLRREEWPTPATEEKLLPVSSKEKGWPLAFWSSRYDVHWGLRPEPPYLEN